MFGGLLIVVEGLSRKFSLSPELMRRLSHISAALFTSYFSLYLSAPFLLTTLGIFSIVMFSSKHLKILSHIHAVSRATVGEILLPLGFIASYLIAGGHQNIYIPAFLIVGIADPITGIIMEKYNNQIIGIFIFVFITIFILSFFNISLIYIVIVALITAFVERVSGYGTDNLTIPIAVALLLRIL